ncbi:facilitated trehalose transporter Tret1-like isoform X2 [Athalia rosae]|uniref:facilitated trehalose transporter Tret1-like isoform X2 n=1 Tax=Athalia rosae TaxID=37344 RepID=UPI0020346B5D|nr:facilitated trehalose transporter Tret1-like isoform X2 [Athalia rosae]
MENRIPQTYVLIPDSGPSTASKDSDLPVWKESYPQITGAFLVHMLCIQAGINMAFSAILVPQLRKENSSIKLETWEEALIASLVTISLPIGSLLCGPLMDRYGRKNVSLCICIPYLTSWIMIFWAYDVVWLYAARALAGAAGGLSSVAIFYTSEIAHPVWRPMLLGLNSLFVSFGILLTAVFGLFFHWRTIAVIFGILSALIFVLITTLPESPHWLLSFKNGTQDLRRVQLARKSLRWFIRNDVKAERELNNLLTIYRARAVNSTVNETFRQKLRSFQKPEIWKPIVLLLVVFFFQQNSGSYVIIFYAVTLFAELGGQFGFVDEYGAMALLGVIRFVMAAVALLLSRRYGRRTLMMVSGFGMGATILVASALMQFMQSDNRIPVLIFVLLFVCFAAIGWQIIPWALTGEMLPTRIKALVGGILISYTYVLMFGVVQTFPLLINLIHAKGAFLSFSVFSLAGTALVWKCLPETFGKTLVEIEQAFK